MRLPKKISHLAAIAVLAVAAALSAGPFVLGGVGPFEDGELEKYVE